MEAAFAPRRPPSAAMRAIPCLTMFVIDFPFLCVGDCLFFELVIAWWVRWFCLAKQLKGIYIFRLSAARPGNTAKTTVSGSTPKTSGTPVVHSSPCCRCVYVWLHG